MALSNTRGIPSISAEIIKDPNKLRMYLAQLEGQIAQIVQDAIASKEPTNANVFIDLQAIRDGLSRSGEYPLNVEGLPGVLAESQIAGILIASSTPPVSQYPIGTLMVQTGSPDTFKYLKAGNPPTWQSISSTPTNMMTTDTAQVVTAAAVKNVQASWVFEVSQSIVNALDANTTLTVQNTNATGTAAAGVTTLRGSSTAFSRIAHGAARVVARCGITLGNWAELFVSAGIGLLINIAGANPIVFGTNGIERARFDGSLDAFDLGAGTSLFGAKVRFWFQTENVTLNTAGLTTDSSANLIPPNALVLGVMLRVTTAITAATTIQIGDAATPARFGTLGTMSLGTTQVCLNHFQGSVTTDAAGPVNFSTAPIRLTANVIPGAGRIRLVTFGLLFTPPTS